ncbi:MAG: family 16 glycosylhydrolase [Microthrixaceae bacterium]
MSDHASPGLTPGPTGGHDTEDARASVHRDTAAGPLPVAGRRLIRHLLGLRAAQAAPGHNKCSRADLSRHREQAGRRPGARRPRALAPAVALAFGLTAAACEAPAAPVPTTTSRPTPTTARPTTTTSKPATTTARPATTTSSPTTVPAGGAPSGTEATIGDRVWDDANANGVQDDGEPGIDGVRVDLYRQTGGALDRVATKTTVRGWYRFKETKPGECYRVEVAAPPGWGFSPADRGSDEQADSDVSAGGRSPTVCLDAAWESGLDAGLVEGGSPTPPTTVPSTTAPSTTAPATTAPATTTPTAPTPEPTGWDLTFADEFNGSTLDTSKWTPEHSTYGDGGGSIHCNTPDNLEVVGGALVIEGRKEAVRCPNNGGRDRDYSTGLVRTRGKFSQAYGRYEVRAQMPTGKGLWTGLWMVSETYPFGHNGQSGEIDIVETLGDRPDQAHTTAHWSYNGCGWGCANSGKSHALTGGDISAWHTYAVEWDPGSITWFIDGRQVYRLGEGGAYKWGDAGAKADNWPSSGGAQNPFPRPFTGDNPMNLILNLQIGGTWPGYPDSTTVFPAQMRVDYVRVYQRS